MNIMEIVSGAVVNGAVRHCILLTRELIRRGHHMTLVCRPGSYIAEQLRDDPVDFVFSDQHCFPPSELRRVAAIAHQRSIDVIHTHMTRAHFFGVVLRCFGSIPCVATAHSRHLQFHWRGNDLVIAVSEATRIYQQRWNRVRPERIVTIPNFIDAGRLANVRQDRDRIRASLNLDEDARLLGVIGSVIPRKGLVYLVEALPAILAQAPNTRLAIISEDGIPRYIAKVKRAVARLGLEPYVLWLGPHNEMPQLLGALDLCVMPSLEENLPLVLLEAMAAGVPIVASGVGGVPECVRSGSTGLLIPPADVAALRDAILALLLDPARAQELARTAQRDIDERFSPQSLVPQIEAALASVVVQR
jgi:glycosyltransferase involved in cell wall biosynthesis